MGNHQALLITLLMSFMFFCRSLSSVHYYDFIVSLEIPTVKVEEKNFTKLCSTKSILTVNGSFPGPTIVVQKGNTAFVTVHNRGNYGVTIHWHGVTQPRDPWSDGPENITQCPIPPGTCFTQKLTFTSEEGTLWWHAHSSWTRATVHGAILIFPADDGYPFPHPHAQEIIIIGEWYKGNVQNIINSALASGGDPSQSDAYTINGEPGDLYDCSRETTFRSLVDCGKTYLFRIINTAMNEEHFFGIAHHNLIVVGVDASYTKPFETNFIMIGPGQTIDVLVTADQTPHQYYIAASPFSDGNVLFDNSTATAILQYINYDLSLSSSPRAIPFPVLPTSNDSGIVFNFSKRLRSLASRDHPVDVPKNVNRRIHMTVSVNVLPCTNSNCSGPMGNRLASSMNNISFQVPSIDILQAYYWNISGVFRGDFPDEPPLYFNFTGDASTGLIPSTGTRVLMLDYNDAVEIVWQGTSLLAAENHPLHLHGYNFYVVGIGLGNFNHATDPLSYNLIDPPLVNTFSLPKNGWVAMRFVANNPGVWFMHCHLERHASWGMDTVLIVRDGGTPKTSLLPPPKYMPPCC